MSGRYNNENTNLSNNSSNNSKIKQALIKIEVPAIEKKTAKF